MQPLTVPGLWLERGVIEEADERLLQSPLGLAGQRYMASMFLQLEARWVATGAMRRWMRRTR